MEGFNIYLDYLSALCTVASSPGWVDIMENGGLVSRCVTENLKHGKPYRRRMDASRHKAFYETLSVMKIDNGSWNFHDHCNLKILGGLH